MLRYRLVFLVAGTLAVMPARSEPQLAKEVLAEGVVLFRAPAALDLWTGTNVVVVVGDEDVTVFDTNTRPGTARQVIAEIRKMTDRPVRTLINSHWHMDHWSGNAEYRKAFPGVRIVSTLATRDYLKRMGPGFFAASAEASRARGREELDEALRTGKEKDGTPLTDEERRARERDIADAATLARERAELPHVLPDVAFEGSLTLWSGRRELRLLTATGDATGSAVLHLPAERILVTGDVLVSPEDGHGPPPWTTNSYAITPWLESLRRLAALDVEVVVPGQGPAFPDKAYLERTIALYAAILDQVHAALERGLFRADDVLAAVNVDEIGKGYTPGQPPGESFHRWVSILARKAYQEALDGVMR
jgi:glyoxylase-like metal-dependent hydrolase (beta-lactamase superfamily II)